MNLVLTIYHLRLLLAVDAGISVELTSPDVVTTGVAGARPRMLTTLSLTSGSLARAVKRPSALAKASSTSIR